MKIDCFTPVMPPRFLHVPCLFGDIEGLQEKLESLSMLVLDYFRKFYGDTALNALLLAY
jgi:hypothetical protein